MTQVFFGGPDKPSGLLRDLLAKHVDSVPPGGEILWATYYFRDLRLAEALVRARHRGVTVKLCIEASPKLKSANDAVRRRLASADGLYLAFHRMRYVQHLGIGFCVLAAATAAAAQDKVVLQKPNLSSRLTISPRRSSSRIRISSGIRSSFNV